MTWERDVRATITRKKAGERLHDDEIADLVAGYVAGDIPDEQVTALLMAGVLRGFDDEEAIALTEALVRSGETIDLSMLAGPTVDKHSTGGVGDTATLVVGPLVAASGMQLAKLSGRALGHTGGTLDKLESIPGFRVDLDPEELREQVERVGLAVAAATQELVPADKKLYALRDLTCTVDSPALIASSVMSKKLAGGAAHIVLDVKTGTGAFMQEEHDAVVLAALCVRIGEAHGRRTAAVVSDMSQPLGPAIGNALEVAAAIRVLRGDEHGRLGQLCTELAAVLLTLAGRDRDTARKEVEDNLTSGRGLEKFRELVAAQGGDQRVVDDPRSVLPTAPVVRDWRSGAGHVQAMDCLRLGLASHGLGAGHAAKGGHVDPAVGLEILTDVGDEVDHGSVVARVHARTDADAERVLAALPELIAVGDEPAQPAPLIRTVVGVGD